VFELLSCYYVNYALQQSQLDAHALFITWLCSQTQGTRASTCTLLKKTRGKVLRKLVFLWSELGLHVRYFLWYSRRVYKPLNHVVTKTPWLYGYCDGKGYFYRYYTWLNIFNEQASDSIILYAFYFLSLAKFLPLSCVLTKEKNISI